MKYCPTQDPFGSGHFIQSAVKIVGRSIRVRIQNADTGAPLAMLTDAILKSLSASEPIKKSDGGGLHICVEPHGRMRWRIAYRFDGKQKSVDGGEYLGRTR